MHVAPRMSKTYPKLTEWLWENMPKVVGKKKVFDAFVKYSELSASTANSVLTKCTANPVIDFDSMPGANGEFRGSTMPNHVYLAKSICEKFENNPEDAKKPEMHILIESTVLHEMVHWGDWKDGKDQPDEEGKSFEKAAYGKDINRYW